MTYALTNLAFRSIDPMTRTEFAEWLKTLPPGDLHHYELLDGFVVMEPPAGWPHGGIEVLIVSRLQAFLDVHPLGRLLGSSQGFDLPTGDTVDPDISFVSNERWAMLPEPVQGFLRVVPDLVVEILSPGTRNIDRKQKKRIYERNGVREYWLVDPKSREVEMFRLVGEGAEQRPGAGRFDGGRIFQASDSLDSLVLAGLRLVVGNLFPAD